MRIAVIGAGITGITTAFELSEDGHEVSVFDRCESVAAEASFATTGLISPGCVSPAAAPGLRRWLLRGLYSHETALRWRPKASRTQWRWLLRWWKANRKAHPADVRAMVDLARVSQERLAWLTDVHHLNYERSTGVLVLLRQEQELAPTHRHADMLRELGIKVEELTPERCRVIEPGLRHTSTLAGALHLTEDSVGNCREFSHLLRDLSTQRSGVNFYFGVEISSIDLAGGRPRLRYASQPAAQAGASLRPSRRASRPADPVLVTATLNQDAGDTVPMSRFPDAAPDEPFDAVVICAGASASPLLKSVGVNLPLMPVYGYSVSFRLRPDGLAPRSAVVDASGGVAIARLGERVRVSGGFELGDLGEKHAEAALAPLYDALHHWFPFATQRAQPQIWKGARPMLPEGPPVIGPAKAAGVWLNLGHGAHGWTLACGSARLLADQIAGRPPLLDADPYSMRRWQS
jgi:D-amino-acid dehydrogenase